MTDDPAGAPPREQRSRAGRVFFIVAGVVVAIAVLLVIADVVVRNIAEQRVAEQIEGKLPPGVDGEVDVSIGGFSVIAQYLTGTMDRVELSAPELTVEGAPLDVDVALQGVPVDFASPIALVDATVVADQATVNRLIAVRGHRGRPHARRRRGRLRAVDRGARHPDPDHRRGHRHPGRGGRHRGARPGRRRRLGRRRHGRPHGLAERLLGDDPIEVCVAERLPQGVEVTAIDVTEGSVRVDAHAADLRLDEAEPRRHRHLRADASSIRPARRAVGRLAGNAAPQGRHASGFRNRSGFARRERSVDSPSREVSRDIRRIQCTRARVAPRARRRQRARRRSSGPSARTATPTGDSSSAASPPPTLAERFGTPALRRRRGRCAGPARVASAPRSTPQRRRVGTDVTVYYAGKAFLSAAIVRWVTEAGLAIDVCTGGELAVALAAGADPARIGFHGNNKSVAEIERAVGAGVGAIVIDSEIEIERVADAAARAGRVQRVRLRVNSGVHASTHEFLATAHEDQKFGVSLERAVELGTRIRSHASLDFLGLHCHIGSQIFDSAGFAESASPPARRARRAARARRRVPELNLGGGFGIAYTSADDPTPIEEIALGIADVGRRRMPRARHPVPKLAFEPGRVDHRPGRRHAVHGRHDQAGADRRRPCATTSRSTAA